MADRTTTTLTAARAGTIDIGGDMPVNRFGFGAMRLTGQGIWGEPADREECKRVLRRALELGINFIDTADSYGPEVSERLIAETLYPYPDELVIATTVVPSTCVGRAWGASSDSGSNRSISTSFTARTQRCRSRNRSGRWWN
jgi:aryl-alcohol dehydrogenase-like predicted oxidoreductase